MSYIAALIVIRSVRQDEGERAQGTGARVGGLRVIQAAGRHDEEMSRDGHGGAHIPANRQTDIQTRLGEITGLHRVFQTSLAICHIMLLYSHVSYCTSTAKGCSMGLNLLSLDHRCFLVLTLTRFRYLSEAFCP